MHAIISVPLIYLIFLLHIDATISQDKYDGGYDLPARDAAFLCVIMDEYLQTGKQPDLTRVLPASLSRQNFTNGQPCWKFAWVPCDAATFQRTTQRPCGWYQMQQTRDAECN